MINVVAKPFIGPVPTTNKTRPEIKVVMLPSRIALIAFLNPSTIATDTGLPKRSSSFTRS